LPGETDETLKRTPLQSDFARLIDDKKKFRVGPRDDPADRSASRQCPGEDTLAIGMRLRKATGMDHEYLPDERNGKKLL